MPHGDYSVVLIRGPCPDVERAKTCPVHRKRRRISRSRRCQSGVIIDEVTVGTLPLGSHLSPYRGITRRRKPTRTGHDRLHTCFRSPSYVKFLDDAVRF